MHIYIVLVSLLCQVNGEIGTQQCRSRFFFNFTMQASTINCLNNFEFEVLRSIAIWDAEVKKGPIETVKLLKIPETVGRWFSEPIHSLKLGISEEI